MFICTCHLLKIPSHHPRGGDYGAFKTPSKINMPIIFCDNNQSNVNKITDIFNKVDNKFFNDELKTNFGDIIEYHQSNPDTKICTASNPDFNAGGGLDLALSKQYPEQWSNSKEFLVTDNLYFLISVNEDIQTNKEIIKNYLSQVLGRRDINPIFTSVGCGIGGFNFETFCQILEDLLSEGDIYYQAIQESPVEGKKSFDQGYKCRDYQFNLDRVNSVDGNVKLCKNGIHFCRTFNDTLSYYPNPDCLANVYGFGWINESIDKLASNHLIIVQTIDKEESYKLYNQGYSNTGYRNTGDSNTGYRNTGDRNTGYSNTGSWNTGYRNTGDNNTGDSNTGDSNTGSWNTGSWNKSNFNSGFFNTVDLPINIFNKPCTKKIWDNCSKPKWLFFAITQWADRKDMTDEEKVKYPNLQGYNKKLNYQEEVFKSWAKAPLEDKKLTLNLPNFDDNVFKEIFGFSAIEELGKLA